MYLSDISLLLNIIFKHYTQERKFNQNLIDFCRYLFRYGHLEMSVDKEKFPCICIFTLLINYLIKLGLKPTENEN